MDESNNTQKNIYEPVSDRKDNASKNRLKSISSTVLILISAPLMALFITAHIFQPYEVDGSSMETTLQNGDRLIVFKLPKTISNIVNSDYSVNRWDVIVFDRPNSLSGGSSNEHLIKRVIALPGERVVVAGGSVTVYNSENPEGFNPDQNQEYNESNIGTSGNKDFTIGPNEVFVLGDNRGNSSDSRVFGPISADSITGKATARFIPVNEMKRL